MCQGHECKECRFGSASGYCANVLGVDPGPKTTIEPQKEIRVVDPKTGGEKCSKSTQFSLIPADAVIALAHHCGGYGNLSMDGLWALADHYHKGTFKYAPHNYLKGYRWTLSLDALLRHLSLFSSGEDLIPRGEGVEPDATAGSCHLIAVAWHCVCLWVFQTRKLGEDDRYKLDADTRTRVRNEEEDCLYDSDSDSYQVRCGNALGGVFEWMVDDDPTRLLEVMRQALELFSLWRRGIGHDDRAKVGV